MEKYKIHLRKKVKKFLIQHRGEKISEEFFKALYLLEVHYKNPLLDIKSLSGYKNTHFRLRIGKYRFLYYIEEGSILIDIYDAGSRGDIYK